MSTFEPLLSASSVGCQPGTEGTPGGLLGSLLCGTWAADGPAGLWQLARAHWPLLVGVAAALIVVRVAVAVARRRMWRAHAAGARWLQVVPPVTATPVATVGLWRLLATVLPAPGRFAARPARLVWEVHATPSGMRCGLWMPPGVNPTAVARVVHRAWPGVRTEQTAPPQLRDGWPILGVALRVTGPEWLPIVDDDPTRASWRPGHLSDEEDDRLRAVYDALAAAGRTGGAVLQVHVSRAPASRVAVLRRATTHPDRARRRGRGASRVIGLVADALRAALIAVLDFATPGPKTRTPVGRSDPYLAEQARQARAKLAAAPHLLVAVHATTTGPTKAAARASGDDITAGFALLGAGFTRARHRRPAEAARWRWVSASAMTLASVVETAALAGLPAQPAAHGLPGAASRRRNPTSDQLGDRHPTAGRHSTPDTSARTEP